ncbi:MAG: type II toxin-antitoxin system VapC family toxin [Ferroplasma sp.]|uniref:type II toxin-antitoxin system VapC family toxin n=1 Tax=Ferroplasma sp. TaxID=2591003 RepID=UPI002814BEEF|nr:type II toxin-antitoxin system VapC family toxin [Ferroplasma sp.]WMT51557.1 MAG: type II toxin-antitoxin system VapC family toxin [Ferroplasma sp.]
MILLDTDIITEILEKKSEKWEMLMLKIIESEEEYCTTPVNMHEVLYGIEKYSKDDHLVLQIPILGYNENDNKLSAVLELSAERKGRAVPRMDAIIASIAINNGCSLYTLDKHFKVFKENGLKLFE